MKQFSLHFDGGAKPSNPGNGYGSYEVKSMVESVTYQRRGDRIPFGWMGNNLAEYTALLHGLKVLLHDSSHGYLSEFVVPKGINLQILSDSKLVVQQVSGRWKVRTPHIREAHDECKALLKSFGHWSIKWNGRDVNMKLFGH